MIHIDHAVPAAPEKICIGRQHGIEGVKGHIGAYDTVCRMDLDIMVGIIRI